MNTQRAQYSPAEGLARRGLIQGLAPVGRAPIDFSAQMAGEAIELSRGFSVTKASISQALRDQQMQMAADLRELGMTEFAVGVERGLGIEVARSSQRGN